jgi:hypothetical protein
MAWWSAWPEAELIFAVLVVPGWALSRCLGVRPAWALATAPVLSAALIGTATVVYPLLGVPWNRVSVLPFLGAVTVAALILARRSKPVPERSEPAWTHAIVLGAVLLAWYLMAKPITEGMRTPDAPSQGWDGVFHLNAVATIRFDGNASPYGGLEPMYGTGGRPVYPTLFHAVASLGNHVVVSINVLIVISALVFLLGMAALARLVSGGSWVAASATPIISASFVSMPSLLIQLNQFPYLLGMALLPGGLTLVGLRYKVVRQQIEVGRSSVRAWAAMLASALLVLAGVSFAHMTMAFVTLYVAAPVLIAATLALALKFSRSDDHGRAIVALSVGIAVVLGMVVLLASDRIQGMANYPRPEQDPVDGLGLGLFGVVDAYRSLYQNVVVAGLVLIGAAVGLVTSRLRWLVAAWAVFLVVFVLAFGGPGMPFHQITGFWYGESHRIRAVLDMLAALLAGAAIPVLVGTMVKRRRYQVAIAAVLTVAVLTGAWETSDRFRWDERRDRWTADIFDPSRLGGAATATAQELHDLHRWGSALPHDAMVIADPQSPAIYLPSIMERRILFPQHSLRGTFPGDYAYLLRHFDRIHEDPAVCAAVERLGVTHFVEVPDEQRSGGRLSASRPGLYGVDTSHGFVHLASSQGVDVWRIAACD